MMPFLQVSSLSKSFPGVKALRDVNLSLNPGEVLAVIGENGAGKSTLMKILAGVQRPDSGQIVLDGRTVAIDSVQKALSLGIVLIHQELNLCDNLDIAGNIFLGREPRRFGFIDRRVIHRDAAAVLARVGLDYSPKAIVSSLTIGRQQMVEIAKALSVNARILIMDEPTSSLSTHESEQLFRVVKDLRNKGISILYISHRLGEVKELADRVMVLRDGQNAGELSRDKISRQRMVRMMVGRDISQFYQRAAHEPGKVVLDVDALQTPAHPGQEISFSLRAGEIVGMAGLVGAGRTELLQTLFGITPARGGQIKVEGRPVSIKSARDAVRAGLALVPEDRKQQGLLLEMAVCENLSLARVRRDAVAGFLSGRAERNISADMIPRLSIKTPSGRQVVQYLSGGNQQKVVIGKWLAMKPRILLLDEPTRGIDVGAKEEIYRLMEQLAGEGVAILFVSSEMEEVMGMSDRTLVMHEGRLTGQLTRDELSEEAILGLATGGVSAAS